MKKKDATKKVDEMLDDLEQCTGNGKWDKHYLQVVDEIRDDFINLLSK